LSLQVFSAFAEDVVPEPLAAESLLEALDSFVTPESFSVDDFVPASEPLVEADEADLESVTYQPLPLNTMPTG
jgi:hypothetical protein